MDAVYYAWQNDSAISCHKHENPPKLAPWGLSCTHIRAGLALRLIVIHAHSCQTASKVPVEQTEQTIFGQQAGDLFRQRVDIAREMIRAHGKPACGG